MSEMFKNGANVVVVCVFALTTSVQGKGGYERSDPDLPSQVRQCLGPPSFAESSAGSRAGVRAQSSPVALEGWEEAVGSRRQCRGLGPWSTACCGP